MGSLSTPVATRTSRRASRPPASRRVRTTCVASERQRVADLGQVVMPDRVRAQFEGAAVFGTSLAMMGEITADAGVPRAAGE